ncbi:hypothetical protein FOXYS1_10610 [Fusarium oxysporum]|uniref:Transcription factor domain-containing protein n=1 Tax=Fusarium oxysporum TaxID=5507 RepID=A0A8H5A4M2_FUSOX|nr:hypothetical protein FOXYS1_10610 [Fusarium oxysporum]
MSTALTALPASISLDSAVVDTLMPDASPTPSEDASQQTSASEEASASSASSEENRVDENEETFNPDGPDAGNSVQISVEDMAIMPLEFDTVAADAFDLSLCLTFDETESASNLDWMRLLDTPSLPELEPHETFAPEQHYHEFGVQPTSRVSQITATPANFPLGWKDSISFHEGAEIFTPSGPVMLLNAPIDVAAGFNNTNTLLNKGVSAPEAGEATIADADTKVNKTSRGNVDDWNICRCNPASRTTTSVRRGELVTCWIGEIDQANMPTMSYEAWRNGHFKTEKTVKRLGLSQITRERMLGILQEIFRCALVLYTLPSNCQRKGALLYPRSSRRFSSSFPLLPSTSNIHEYIEVFLTNFEPLYPVISKGTLDPNEFVPDSAEETTSLTLFLIIAYGMIRDTNVRHHRLAVGLLDACQLSLMNLVERENRTPRPNMTFLSTSLCTFQAAFSGDKWLMDLSQGLRSMYLGLAKFHSLFERQPPYSAGLAAVHEGLESVWKSWTHMEESSRFAYSWLMIDQEMGLFYDNGPSIPTAEVQTPLPDYDSLWLAQDAESWNHAAGDVSTSLQREEIKELLQKWYDLLTQSAPPDSRQWLLCQVSLILYHLISLNLCASVPDIELVARGEFRQHSSNIEDLSALALPYRCIQAREEAIFHCGQVLRLLREMEPVVRPLWWPLALYRVAIILWAIGLKHLPQNQDLSSKHHLGTNVHNPYSSEFAIDAVTPDDYRWRIFVQQKQGIPCLTKDDTNVRVEDINGTLEICAGFLGGPLASSPLAAGVARKLSTLTIPSS